MSKDTLGDRMKDYEGRSRYMLNRRGYTIIRIDGKAFHTYTKGLTRPFDNDLIEDMNLTTQYLCENIQGCKIGYVQSDEITLVLTDFDNYETSAWFDGNIQKITSISASLATAKFNQLRLSKYGVDHKLAMFDSRAFQVSTHTEVRNNLLWRQQDATRNSISAVAQSLYSHKDLHQKNTNQMQEMCFQKGINWNDYDDGLKRGRMCIKETEEVNDTVRSKWVIYGSPIFSSDLGKTILETRIPKND